MTEERRKNIARLDPAIICWTCSPSRRQPRGWSPSNHEAAWTHAQNNPKHIMFAARVKDGSHVQPPG